MCHLWQVKNCLFGRNIMFRSQDIQFFLFVTITWFTKSVTSWWVLVHKTRCICEYFLSHNSLSNQTWSIDRYKRGQRCSGIFWTIWRTGAKFQVLFNLAPCSNYWITNYVKIIMFHSFEKVNEGCNEKLKMSTIKNGQISLCCHTVILNHKKAWNYHPGHNILRHLDVWQNFRVTRSETNRDY